MNNVLEVAFVFLAGLFAVWNLMAFRAYFLYLQLAGTAELTWYMPRPWFYSLAQGIGALMVLLTAFSLFILDRSWIIVLSQALMAAYYIVLLPLSVKVRRGFYSQGIWLDRAFVPYDQICTLCWKEHPNIVLMVTKKKDYLSRDYLLNVPGDKYGEVRRILAGHIKDQTLTIKHSVLGLSDKEMPAQEQV